MHVLLDTVIPSTQSYGYGPVASSSCKTSLFRFEMKQTTPADIESVVFYMYPLFIFLANINGLVAITVPFIQLTIQNALVTLTHSGGALQGINALLGSTRH